MESGEHMPNKPKVPISLAVSLAYFPPLYLIFSVLYASKVVINLISVSRFIQKLFQFVGELARVAAPGGTIIIVTWCHRDLRPDEESLQQWEKDLLKKICDSFYLPEWCSTADYVKLLETMSLQVVN